MTKQSFSKPSRTALPLIAVLIASLMSGYLVYDNYFADRGMAAQVSNIEPAAGFAAMTPGG